jgi:hypothetical protein
METAIDTKQSAKEICQENGLDFVISKRPLFDSLCNPSGYFGLWNDSIGKCIHTVKSGYTVSQNQEVIEMVLKGIEPFKHLLRVQKAGVLNEGRKVFIQLEVEGTSLVANDTIKRYITIIDSNDGSTSLSVGIGDLTMSCMNQFWKFYRKGNKMRHSVSLEQKLKELPKLIETALNQSMVQIDLYNRLAETPIVDYTIIDKIVNAVLGFDKTSGSIILDSKSGKSLEKMAKLYEAIRTEMNGKGLNLWGLHSGVTRFTTHDVEHKAKRENIRLESQLTGSSYDMNQKSLNFVSNLLVA